VIAFMSVFSGLFAPVKFTGVFCFNLKKGLYICIVIG